MHSVVGLLTRYKAWANQLTFAAVMELPAIEATKKRPTTFDSIANTLNHVLIVDDIFRHHATGRQHPYVSRTPVNHPDLSEIWNQQQEIDAWWINHADSLDQAGLSQEIDFTFVEGGNGRLTGEQIILHIVDHATYHRGYVCDMMYQIPAVPPATDLTIFLRDSRPPRHPGRP